MSTIVPPRPGSFDPRSGASYAPELGDGNLLGRFVLDAELGRGSLGVVYRATLRRLGLQVALRVIQDSVPAGRIQTRLHQVVPMIQSFSHPGVVRVYDFDQAHDRILIVMEYVEGRSLRAWLGERGRLPPDVALH